MSNYLSGDLASLLLRIDRVRVYLTENWDSPDSEEIAEILGIEITKEIDLEVVIKGTVQVRVPIGYDTSDIRYISGSINNFEFDDSDIEVLDFDLNLDSTTEV